MANVYIVVRKLQFKTDTLVGAHISMGDVGKNDVFSFSNKDKAIEFVLGKIEEEKESKFGCPKYNKYDFGDRISYSQNEWNDNNIKHKWDIFKVKIN